MDDSPLVVRIDAAMELIQLVLQQGVNVQQV